METNTGKPCQICGGIGYAKCIVTCSKCLKAREHMYCMQPNLNYIPQSWLCEACRCPGPRRFTARKNVLVRKVLTKVFDVKNSVGSSSGKLAAPPSTIMEKQYLKKYARHSKNLPISNARMSTAKHQASHLSQPLHGLRSSLESPCKFLKSEDINSVRVTSIGDERHISDEAHRSPQNYTGPLAYDVRGKSNIKNILSKLDQLPDQVDSILCTNVCQEKPVDAVLQYNETGTSEAKTSFKVNQIASNLLNAQQGIEHENASGKLDMHADEVSTSNIEPSLLKNVYKVANTDADAWFNVNEASKSQTSYREENTLNSPTGHSSWKGSFEILNFPLERFDGLQAYPPQRVSRNAYLASKQMPRILQFTLQPHHDVWPATFHSHSPSGLDIGLYLLPNHFCRIKEKYNGLVELMEKDDLSLRSCFNGVELLIFTSRRLPSESQRLNKQVYLWAVFLSSKGRRSSVGLRDVIDNASPNHKPEENLATVPHEFLDQIVDTVDDTVGDKEVDKVDKCFRSNFRDACSSSLNMTSQGVVFGAVLSQPVHKGTTATHLQEVKREPYDDLGVLPGFSKRQPDQKFTVGSHLHQVKTNHCNEFDPPPGFSRPVKSNASVVGPTIAMSPAVNKLDASPGFSELLNLKLCASSSKHSPPVLNANVVGKVRKTPRMRTRFLPNLLLPSSDKSKYPCSQSDENGGGGIDMAIRTPHDQLLPSDKSKNSCSRSDENGGGGINMVMRSPHDQLLQSPDKSKQSCSQSDENGGGGTNMAIRSLHDQMKEMFMTQFTQEQMYKMSSFAEKVGWSISKQEESVVQQFCQEIGVRRPALNVWMNYKKQDMNVHSSSASKRKSVPDEQDGGGEINLTTRSPNHQVKKRLRTRFTREQRDNMLSFAEKLGWSISSQDEAEVQKFCQGTGISSRVLKVWMHNKKHNLKIKPSGSCTRKSLSPDRSNPFPLKSDEQDVGRGLDDAVKPSYFQVKKRFKTTLTQEQKNKVLSFAEKVGWCIRGQEEAVLQQLCQEIGVERRVLAVWMDSNKHKFSKKINFSTACTTKSQSPDILSPLCSESSRDLNVGNRTPHHQVRKSFDQFLRNSSMDAYSRSLNMASQSQGVSTTTVPSKEVKKEHCDYSDAPPGFATQVSSNASVERTIARSEVKISPVNQVDEPPDFSDLIHLKCLDSTSEIAHKMKKQKTNDSMSKGTALPLNYRIAEGSENVAQEDNDQIVDMEIDMVGGIEVERVDKRSGRNFMATCTSNLDISPKCVSSGNVLSQPVDRGVTKMYSQEVNLENCDDLDSPPGFSRVHSSHPVLACNVVRNMHQVETDYCNDYAPPGFSRTVMSSAADVRPIATLHVTMPPVVDNEDASPGFSELIKRKQWDSLSEWSSPTPNTNLVGMESKSSPTQLLLSPERSKPVEDKSCFCRICNLSCSGMGSFMQHLAGKKHVFGIQDFLRAMRCKEDYERHGTYYLSSLYKSSDAAYRSSELCDRNMRYEANFGSNGRYCLSPSTR